jgi:hypothetical protein
MKLIWGVSTFIQGFLIFFIFVRLSKWRQQMLKKEHQIKSKVHKKIRNLQKKKFQKKVFTIVWKFIPKNNCWFQSPKVRDKGRNDQITIFASSK